MGFLFTAQNFASATFKQIGRDFRTMDATTSTSAARVQKSMQSVAAGGILAGVGAAGIAAGLGLANAAGKFEMGLAGVAAVSRATTAELGDLEKAAIQAGINTQFSPTEAVEGLRSLAVQGFGAKEAIQALNPALDLAAGGQISVAQAASTSASALRAFGLETSQAAITTDKLLRISNSTALQAKDLQIALGNVSRGAGLAGQSINEMLPSIGLVKNTGVDASVAANAVSSALIFMSKSGSKFKKMGVQLTDAKGKFRPFLDVVLETNKVMQRKFPDAAQRSAQAVKLFGRFGVSAFQAIASQSKTGIRTTTGEVLKGADAIAHLRNEMQTAAGAAEEFRSKLLDTFEGQKTLLRGSLETAAVVFGKPFTRVLKPVVSIVIDVVNALISAWTNVPAGMQDAISSLFLAGSAILGAVGSVLLLNGMLGLMGLKLTALAGIIGGALLSLVPFAIAIAAAALVVKAFMIAVEKNLGGIGGAFTRMFEGAKLVFQGLVQLFTTGAFSGAVMRDLNRAENAGIKRFVINVFLMANRIKNFFAGVATGFSTAIASAEPVFRRFTDALKELAAEFGFLTDAADPGEAQRAFNEWGVAGESFGDIVASVVTVAIDMLTTAIQFGVGVVRGFKAAWVAIGPAFEFAADALKDLGKTMEPVLERLGIMSPTLEQGKEGAQGFGMVVGALVAGLIKGAALAVGAIADLVNGFVKLADQAFGALGDAIIQLQDQWLDLKTNFALLWISIKSTVRNAVRGIGGFFNDLGNRAGRMWGRFKNLAAAALRATTSQLLKWARTTVNVLDSVLAIAGVETGAQQAIERLQTELVVSRAGASRDGIPIEKRFVATPTLAASATAAERQAREANIQGRLDQVRGRGTFDEDQLQRIEAAIRGRPIQVSLEVDGEVVAGAVASANDALSSRSLAPVPLGR